MMYAIMPTVSSYSAVLLSCGSLLHQFHFIKGLLLPMPHGICVCNGYFESDYIEEEKYGRRETAKCMHNQGYA